jgi:putative (di)nucleoside polyphosphate hydrolase
VVNRQGLVWVGRRAEARHHNEGKGQWWQMPQGGIDDSEAPATAALRELAEETGMVSVEMIGEAPDWYLYDLPPELVGKAWGGRYRGQTQKWFAVRFIGDDSEIDIAPEPGHEAEFEAWRWAPLSALVEMVVPFKRRVYEQVVAALAPSIGPKPG